MIYECMIRRMGYLCEKQNTEKCNLPHNKICKNAKMQF